MAKPLVSILIPAYNAQLWIEDTLRSAIGQDWERKEIIVVDDGSSDATLAMARRFESDSVRVVSQKNQGAAAARNFAFSLSRGDYIQWLDADDLLAPDKVRLQMERLAHCAEKRPLLCSAWGKFVCRPHRAVFRPTALWADLSPSEWLLRKMGQNVYMQTAVWLVSRELSEAAGPWNTELLGDDDGEYFCRVLLASDGVRFVPASKVYYRAAGPASLSYVGRSNRKIEAHWRSMRLHLSYLRSLEDSERTRAACLNYLRASLLYFYPERPDIVAEAEQAARELGLTLGSPELPRKYEVIKRLFGWSAAKQAQLSLLRAKWRVNKLWDQACLRFDRPDICAARN